jgi:hypothetical protein
MWAAPYNTMIKIRYVIATVALATALGLNLGALVMHTNAQATPNHAGLIIQSPNGQITTRCITFDEPEITGYELLRRSNLPLVVDIASGGIVCKIQNTGCNFPAQKCFCECQDMVQSCVYWQYYFQSSGVWKYSPQGMFGQKVTNGSVNGWSYGAGGASSGGAAPPLMTVDQICGAAVAPPATAQLATQTAAVSSPVPANTSTAVKPTAPATPKPAPTVTGAIGAASTSSSVASRTPAPFETVTTRATEIPMSSPTVESTATSEPKATIAPLPTVEQTTPAQPDTPSPTGYIAFGVIVVVLGGLLLVTRAGMGKTKL